MKDKPTTKKILLVDDEETLRLSIKQVLSEDGYEVIIAKNGAEALGFLRAEGFDLVITDLRMPGLSGLQLVSEIKKINPSTKIIIISAYGTMETVVEAMRLGVNDFVAKPFKVKSMKEIVTGVLNASKKKLMTGPTHSSLLDGLGITTDNGLAAEKETCTTIAASDAVLIQPRLSYYLDRLQGASTGDSTFFDVTDVAEKKLALIFGSMPSIYDGDTSMLGTMVKTVFRTIAIPFIMNNELDNRNRPQYVVEKINKYLCINTKPRIPVSLFCALIDKNRGVIEYTNQGQKLFCCLLNEDSKIVALESSPYPLNLFPDIYIEEKKSLLTSKSRLMLLSSDSLAALPVSEKSVMAKLKGIFLEACSWMPVDNRQGDNEVSNNCKETVRKVRISLSNVLPPDTNWTLAVVALNWNDAELQQKKIIIPASTNDFRGIISQIENILKGFALTPQDEHGIVTAINEAIINARLYAYNDGSNRPGNTKTGDIVVQFMVVGNELVVGVFDNGCGFSVQSYKKPDFADYQSITMESGRGISLIQKLMDRVMIQSSDNIGTRVYMAKEVISNGC